MWPFKEPPESVSEEQKEKSTVEGIAGGLRTSAALSLLAFISSLVVVGIVYFGRGEAVTSWEEPFRYLIMVCGFSFLAWYFCHAARYILVDVTSDMQKPKPNVMGRIGQVTYWLGCAVGILSIPASAFLWVGGLGWGGRIDAELLVMILVCLAVGAAAWLVGRGARYILKGD